MLKSVTSTVIFLTISFLGFCQSSKPRVTVFVGGESKEYTLSKSTALVNYKILSVDSDGGSVDFSPSDIDGFLLENGKKYLAYPVRNSNEKIFLQVLFEGEISLGFFNSGYYLILNKEAIPLTEDSVGGQVNSSGASKRKTYLGVLHFAMDGCSEEVSSQINGTKLSFPSLENLFISYHECKGISYSVPGESQPYLGFRFSFGLGYSSLNSVVKPSISESRSSGLRVDAMVQFELNKFFPRLMPELGLAHTGFEDKWVFGKVLNPGQEQFYYEETYRMRLVEIIAVINYKIIDNASHELYLGVGPKYTFTTKNTISELSQYEFMRPEPPFAIIVRPRDPVLLEADNRFGFVSKVGYSRKLGKFSPFVEVQYDQVSKLGFLNFPLSSVYEYSLSSISGKLGFKF